MKNFILSLLALFFFSSCSSEPVWLNDYDEALELAQKQNKDVYMFIAADKCKYCKMFQEQTLSQKHVMDTLTRDYVLLYLSRDQHLIPDGYEIYGAPRHYFLTKNGDTILESFGFLEPDGFLLLLEEADLNKAD